MDNIKEKHKDKFNEYCSNIFNEVLSKNIISINIEYKYSDFFKVHHGEKPKHRKTLIVVFEEN